MQRRESDYVSFELVFWNLGAKVSDTIRKGIIDPTLFEDPKELMLGQVSSLLSKLIRHASFSRLIVLFDIFLQ